MSGTLYANTLYRRDGSTPDTPQWLGAINIDRVRVHIAVYPPKRATSGRMIRKVLLRYPLSESGRLVNIEGEE